MVDRDLRVGLPTAERRHQVDDGLPADPVHSLQCLGPQVLQAPGDVGAVEELDRVAILRSGDTLGNLAEISGELCQLERSLRDIVVGLDHVDAKSQLMYKRIQHGVTDFGSGDLTGLAALGKGGCFPNL